jgi:hypothetical protein
MTEMSRRVRWDVHHLDAAFATFFLRDRIGQLKPPGNTMIEPGSKAFLRRAGCTNERSDQQN